MQGFQSELSLIVHASTIVIVIYYFNNEFPTFSICVLNSSWSSSVLWDTVLQYFCLFHHFQFFTEL
jgi:hypothetical protein